VGASNALELITNIMFLLGFPVRMMDEGTSFFVSKTLDTALDTPFAFRLLLVALIHHIQLVSTSGKS
jgi:hypothetical protein